MDVDHANRLGPDYPLAVITNGLTGGVNGARYGFPFKEHPEVPMSECWPEPRQ